MNSKFTGLLTRPAIDDVDLYGRAYFNKYYTHGDRKRDAMYWQEYKRIMERAKRAGRVLDVGCGIGSFLTIMDDRWEKWGYDPSEFAAEMSRKKGIRMVNDVGGLESETFDLVVFRGTLQHINFPMRALSHATRILKPGGLLVVLATPDADSLVYRIWGNLPALDAPRNWIVFGSRMLANIMVRLGYDDVEILHPYLGTPYASPVRDFCKFAVSLFFGWRKFAFPGNQFELYARKK